MNLVCILLTGDQLAQWVLVCFPSSSGVELRGLPIWKAVNVSVPCDKEVTTRVHKYHSALYLQGQCVPHYYKIL